MRNETIFTMDASSIKYGAGATAEVGADAFDRGMRRVALFTDAGVARTQAYETALRSLQASGLDVHTYTNVRVEPTDASFGEAIAWATEIQPDGYIAVGGGSVIDTAKAANLYTTWPADLLTYVNAPIGLATPVPGPLKPLIAIPTTAGTGSETTGVAIFDLVSMHAKTGIAHRALRPVLGIVDPLNTLSMPAMVTAASALDVLSHAIESYTALPFDKRPAPESPKLRPSYQGANPISDLWSGQAMAMMAASLPQVLAQPDDLEARGQMMLAATYAGIGFGNAGVHLPHGMSYPVAGMVRSWRPEGYPADHAIVPHGISVILNAPAVFRFTAVANPERHLQAAKLLGADITGATTDDAGEVLANRLIEIMRQTGMPNGLGAIGYSEADLDGLVAGTLPQHRVTKLSPRPASAEDLRAIFTDAMRYW
ncbi:MAG TPA: hydroxyacid-oxoacid transhydrogenase [Thermomicrobiales bacterium]|nr:hydroxyacid-oxoacid transhydrogenase [Thermomicrobiales bacterium]HRA46688.1 hydroxyacid-oxoacid transhydrogenase [Thermomicrobiales bacterium]